MVGAIVFATEQGLGYLAKDFYDNGLIDKVYVFPHRQRTTHYEWFPNRVAEPEDLLDCDTILMFETPIDWTIIPKAREKGIKTVLMPMYECTPFPNPYQVDLLLAPSDLDLQYYPEAERINVPVPKEIKWKLRERAKVFVHNTGNGGIGGRNGTKELLEAMKFVKSPIKLIIRSQNVTYETDDPRIEIVNESVPFEEMYTEGDVFIFPEKFNGLSLPIQEAFASGMAIMCGDRFPMNTWLPNELLIPIDSYRKEYIGTQFDLAVIHPLQIAKMIDSWYDKDISQFSKAGKDWGEENTWNKLLPEYKKLI